MTKTQKPRGMMVRDRTATHPERKPHQVKIVCRDCGTSPGYIVEGWTVDPYLPLPPDIVCSDCGKELQRPGKGAD